MVIFFETGQVINNTIKRDLLLMNVFVYQCYSLNEEHTWLQRESHYFDRQTFFEELFGVWGFFMVRFFHIIPFYWIQHSGWRFSEFNHDNIILCSIRQSVSTIRDSTSLHI